VFACLMVCRWQVRHGDSDKDRGRSRRPGAKDRRWLGIGQVLNGRTIGRLSDTMCDLHHT
jgi:hypothetical protein